MGELRSFSKLTKAKRTEDMAHIVEHLPSKCKALSSTPSTEKKISGNFSKIQLQAEQNCEFFNAENLCGG
jgi:hypothetical protein